MASQLLPGSQLALPMLLTPVVRHTVSRCNNSDHSSSRLVILNSYFSLIQKTTTVAIPLLKMEAVWRTWPKSTWSQVLPLADYALCRAGSPFVSLALAAHWFQSGLWSRTVEKLSELALQTCIFYYPTPQPGFQLITSIGCCFFKLNNLYLSACYTSHTILLRAQSTQV